MAASSEHPAVHAPPSKAKQPKGVMHGFFVLHAKSGSTLYSQRFTNAFGLTSCETLAKDELRLAAMLFALHLNAAAAATNDADESSKGLTAYHLGGVNVRFCQHPRTELLLVLFAPESLGSPAAGFLASELLQRFEACFAEALASDTRIRQGALKRSAFAASLREAIAALHAWCLGRALDEARACIALPALPASLFVAAAQGSTSPRLEFGNLASMHSASMCESLATSAPIGRVEKEDPKKEDPKSGQRKAKPVARVLVASATTASPLLSIVGLQPEDGSSALDARRPPRGLLASLCGAFLPGHALVKPKPPPPPLPPSPPLLFWCNGIDTPVAPPADAKAHVHLRQIVGDLHAAWRHAALPCMSAIHTGLDTTTRGQASFAVALLHSPMVLRVRGCVHTPAARELAAMGDDPWLAALVAAISSALERWVAPLTLTLSFLGASPAS